MTCYSNLDKWQFEDGIAIAFHQETVLQSSCCEVHNQDSQIKLGMASTNWQITKRAKTLDVCILH